MAFNSGGAIGSSPTGTEASSASREPVVISGAWMTTPIGAGPVGASILNYAGSIVAGVGSAAGSSTAYGFSDPGVSIGFASGTSTVSAVSAATSAADGSSAGVSNVDGSGASIVAAAGSAAGTSTASSNPEVYGLAYGTSTATATGASTAKSYGSAAGVATASGVGVAYYISTGSSAGTSAVSAVSRALFIVKGTASGNSTAIAVGSFTFNGVFYGTDPEVMCVASEYKTIIAANENKTMTAEYRRRAC